MLAEAEAIRQRVDQLLPEEDGFESYLFKIGSYNSNVGTEFKLPYDGNTMALLIISTPNMFDVSFKRWVQEMTKELGGFDMLKEEISSPIQQFLEHRLEAVREAMPATKFDLFHDHSLWPNRKPKVLMCTCGHVAGAAYYYQPKDLAKEDWPPAKKLEGQSKFIGLSLHSQYAGHFAFRSVLIFPEMQLPEDFKESSPNRILNSEEQAREALELFNYGWRDSKFRDCGNPKRRYSQTQIQFFGTPPAQRWDVIRHWVDEM